MGWAPLLPEALMYKAILAYDGTHYFGWQKTKTGPSIQEELEKAIYQMSRENCLPEAASRTDRGVHAEGQVIQFELQKEWPCESLCKALNGILPTDIRLLHIEKKVFHPTLDAIRKEYRYQIMGGIAPDPTLKLYAWHIPLPLNCAHIEEAILPLLGTHDFSAFAGEKEKDPICHLESLSFDGKMFYIRGERFLYKMVRNLVGTLVYVGLGKLTPNAIASILESKKRALAGITAPAHGLYLHQVDYPLNCLP